MIRKEKGIYVRRQWNVVEHANFLHKIIPDLLPRNAKLRALGNATVTVVWPEEFQAVRRSARLKNMNPEQIIKAINPDLGGTSSRLKVNLREPKLIRFTGKETYIGYGFDPAALESERTWIFNKVNDIAGEQCPWPQEPSKKQGLLAVIGARSGVKMDNLLQEELIRAHPFTATLLGATAVVYD